MTQIHQKLNNKYLGRETTKKKKKGRKGASRQEFVKGVHPSESSLIQSHPSAGRGLENTLYIS